MHKDDAIVIERAKVVFKTFLAELENRKHLVEYRDMGAGENRIIKLDDVAFEISLHPERRSWSGYNSPLFRNKLRIKVGHWSDGRRKQFPEPKKGFDWKKIIDYIEEYMGQRRIRIDTDARAEANYETAKATVERIEEIHKPKNIWLSARSNSDDKPRIDIHIDYLSMEDTGRVVGVLVKELPEIFGEE